MLVRNPEAHKKIWVESLGAEVVKSGSLELLKLRGIFLVLEKAEPAEGSEGSSVDHSAFRAKDLPAVKAKLIAAGVPITREDAREIVLMFPDKVKVEFYASPTITSSLQNYHGHFFSTDPEALRAWYTKHFGAETIVEKDTTITFVPGLVFNFRKVDKPLAATKGRSLDHVGLEVKGLEAFCKKLAAAGVAFETPFRNEPGIGLKTAVVIDPVGTRIELTEGLPRERLPGR